jgi:RNA polymerase-binding transcription factor DksA
MRGDTLTPSAWRLEQDTREIDAAPVRVPCEQCGREFPLAQEDAADETRLCVACVRAVARAPLVIPVWPEDLWF